MLENHEPFGNPDGSRAPLDEMQQDFITFGDTIAWSGISMKSDDRTVRVIVGKKGSGKTIYLRRLQADASQENSVFANKPEFDTALPSTESVIKFRELYSDSPNIEERWMRVWYAAILRSLVSHFLTNPNLKTFVADDKRDILKARFKELYREFGTPVSVYGQVNEILTDQDYRTAYKFTSYLDHYLWAELEYEIQEIFKGCPPVLIYIDAVDEQFEKAPMHWLKCQEGLFHQVMRFLRHPDLGGRLHIVICVRDVVLSSIYRSEHQTRYFNEPHIRVLKWNKRTISYFLNQKISRLPKQFFLGNFRNGKTLQTWLGLEKIENVSRKCLEPIEQYLLRHTRLLPRDIINLGNRLCEEIINSRLESQFDKEQLIRKAVADSARRFGDEQIRICSSQILASLMPGDAVQKKYASAYVANDEYAKTVASEIKEILRDVGTDLLTEGDMNRIDRLAARRWDNHRYLLAILWQNGLLGYKTSGSEPRHVFFDEEGDFDLPRRYKQYVLHSILIDAVGLNKVSQEPVINFH